MDRSIDLLPVPDAARSARRWVRGLLTPGVDDDTSDTVELVVTELVQNAVLHSNTPLSLRMTWDDGQVCVGVTDGSPVLPSSGLTDDEAMSGRGLLMVAAVASSWGAYALDGGKVVWACVSGTADEAGATGTTGTRSGDGGPQHWADAARTPLQRSDPAPLLVRGLPTATMLAVKTHNDDVFRELTLYAMGDRAPAEEQASELVRLARRARDVLASFGDGRQQVRDQVLAAADAGADTFDLTLATDEAALAVLEDYLDILETADGWAARGLFLSGPPPAQVLAVRRRYLTELLAQMRAR